MITKIIKGTSLSQRVIKRRKSIEQRFYAKRGKWMANLLKWATAYTDMPVSSSEGTRLYQRKTSKPSARFFPLVFRKQGNRSQDGVSVKYLIMRGSIYYAHKESSLLHCASIFSFFLLVLLQEWRKDVLTEPTHASFPVPPSQREFIFPRSA